jgi:DNA polymerase III subunit delta'
LSEGTPESDRLADTPHPRETTVLYGQHFAERALLEAYCSGRIHHAWLLCGPSGIGKVTLAYRMAKFVLANPEPSANIAATSLATDPENRAARQVVSQSHSDLTALRRVWNTERKTFYGDIRVEDARNLVRFFGSTSGMGGWRIAIVDAADDLNAASANALLKVLEEPPRRSLFLIVANQPGRLLPTIRSRCRRLDMAALEEGDLLAAAANARPDIDRPALEAGARLADGSVRRAISLAEGEGVALHAELSAALRRLPDLDTRALHALADRCAGKRGDENFALLMTFLADWLHDRLRQEAEGSPGRLARWAEVWEKASRMGRDVETYNLDRKPFILSTLSMLAEVSRAR